MLYAGSHGTLPSLSLLAGAVYWGGLNIVLLTGFVTRGWHGVEWARQATRAQSGPALPANKAISPVEAETPV